MFFGLDTPQPIDGRKKRKTHAQNIIREELNTVNAKIVSYTKLKSTGGLSTELSDSLRWMTYGIFGKNRKFGVFVETSPITLYERFCSDKNAYHWL